MSEKNKVTWTMVKEYTHFNQWECRSEKSGATYQEAFPKHIDPNELLPYGHAHHYNEGEYNENRLKRGGKGKSPYFNPYVDGPDYKTNPYKYQMYKQRLSNEDMARILGMPVKDFIHAMNGQLYFSMGQLHIINDTLGFGNCGYNDMRFETDPELWRNRYYGPLEYSEGYILNERLKRKGK